MSAAMFKGSHDLSAAETTAAISAVEDDDPPMLSSRALEALREFLNEQQVRGPADVDQDNNDGEDGGGTVELVSEDWRLSQFWYDRKTAETIAEEIQRLCGSTSASSSPRVACIACPTLYPYIKKADPSIPVQLLEYDRRFEQYGSDFIFYDYNQAEELPPDLKHAFSIVVADPPYLSQECLEKVAQTVDFLAKPQESYVLLLTGEVQKERAAQLLSLHPCGFRPQHSSKLGNEFRLFTNYNPADSLGGWEEKC